MTTTLLVTTIITYVLSLAATLIFGITSKKFRPEAIRWPALVHVTLILLATILSLALHPAAPYTVLFAFCTGLAIAGWALRTTYLALPFRIYFGFYLLSVLLFLSSPSRLFYIISGNGLDYRKEKEYHLRDNYYLVEQESLVKNNRESSAWKVIQKFGIYKKTIRRDVSFGFTPDSVRLLTFSPDTMILRGFRAGTDSMDKGFRPGVKKQEIKQLKK